MVEINKNFEVLKLKMKKNLRKKKVLHLSKKLSHIAL
jgi:hypothetical protein